MKKDILIIGAGLTGLLLAYRLKTAGYSVQLLEARDRLGGRIHTLQSEGNTPIEMGATWLGNQHQALVRLLRELDLPVFEQYMTGKALFEPLSTQPAQEIDIPANDSPSYRIEGGSSTLIEKLASHLDKTAISLNIVVTHIEEIPDGVRVSAGKQFWMAKQVVSTLPPNLFINTIECTPHLPEGLVQLGKQTHTWMGDSIKFGVSYARPFWREKGFSGTLFSNVGPITELYDHSNLAEDRFALKGFLSSGLSQDTFEHRKEKVMAQLNRVFGDKATDFLAYEECVWQDETRTYIPYANYVLPHHNNGHQNFQTLYLNNKLLIAGSETAAHFGGYMEGAVRSAEYTTQKILSLIKDGQ
ncbi:MAG: monoamine oxidase [Flavobacteriales bacterium]|jgi:monoamine oxidase